MYVSKGIFAYLGIFSSKYIKIYSELEVSESIFKFKNILWNPNQKYKNIF